MLDVYHAASDGYATGVVRRTLFALALALPLLVTATARAQVNTENLRKRIKTVGYSVLIEGSLTGDSGNTEGITTGGGVGGGWGRAPHLVFAYARADYAKYAGVTSVNKSFAHARYNYEFVEWAWGELFAQAQSDQFQRMKLRNLFGIGPRFRLARAEVGKELAVYYGTAYMFERDVVTVAPGAPDANVQVWDRWSNYVTAQWELDERVILASSLYVQPALEDFANVRVLDETLFTFKVTPWLNASIAGSVKYDSAPPTAVKTTDLEVKNSLGLTF
jgi:hypothetical protein